MQHKILINKNEQQTEKDAVNNFIKNFEHKLEGSIKIMLLNSCIYGNNKITKLINILEVEDKKDKILLTYDVSIRINNEFILFREIDSLQNIRESKIQDYFIHVDELKDIIKNRYVSFKENIIVRGNNLREEHDKKAEKEAKHFINKIQYILKNLLSLTRIDYNFYYNKELFERSSLTYSNLDIHIDTKQEKIKTDFPNQYIFTIRQKIKIKIDGKSYNLGEYLLCEVYQYE